MKKFVFSNEKYHGIKTNEYDTLKRKMQSVDKSIETVVALINELATRFEIERQSYIKACREGISVERIHSYHAFFPYLREEQKKAQLERQRLEEEKRKLREALIKLFNELKALEKMREEQIGRAHV